MCCVVLLCASVGVQVQNIRRFLEQHKSAELPRKVEMWCFSQVEKEKEKKKCRNFKMWLRLLAVLTVTGCFINPSAYLLETNYIKKKRLDDKVQPDESTLLNCNNLKPTGKVHFSSGAFFSSGPFVSKCQVIPSIALNY